MIGGGQDEAAARARPGPNTAVRWIPWVPAAELPALVAGHDVCLGIFGTGDKALRVVPNKVFQGAAPAVPSSPRLAQRRALGSAAILVPPGDAEELAAPCSGWQATALSWPGCAGRRGLAAEFAPERIVAPLLGGSSRAAPPPLPPLAQRSPS